VLFDIIIDINYVDFILMCHLNFDQQVN